MPVRAQLELMDVWITEQKSAHAVSVIRQQNALTGKQGYLRKKRRLVSRACEEY